jgi:hypothetical protein
MMIYKTYWFDGDEDGDSVEDMVKVYEGSDEAEAMRIAERYEDRGRQVEVWEGEPGDDTTDALIYP